MSELRWLLLSLVVGCPAAAVDEGATEGVTSSTANGSSSASTLADASSSSTTTGPALDDTHGYVVVRFDEDPVQASDPYLGTAEVQVQFSYGDCDRQFYADLPSWAVDGVDGSEVFEEWRDRLCTEEVPGRAQCEVSDIEQLLDPSASRLSVTYRIDGPLSERALLFGPLPLPGLTQCDAPRVRLEFGGTRGLDASGSVLWTLSSSDVMEVAPFEDIHLRARTG